MACPDDRRLADLVGELSVQDDQFRQRWGGHPVVPRTGGTKVFHHRSPVNSPSPGTPSPA
ncbi:MmyB family transcriptional regulator [Streptomyces sp. 3213.3]|uniref:MmyB family transcriptional regulator n=1 Tax=Streptomyces sp. 3213.3 TaxID=1855348 RepID=UPI003FA70767